MPARNVQKYVEEAILSVLGQRGVDFELLIMDDASQDETWMRIRKYKKDPRVRAWKSAKRKGPAAARNFLVSRARGKYLSFCDADDRFLPGFLKRLSGELERNPKAGVVYCDRLLLKGNGRPHLKKDKRPSGQWDLTEGVIGNPGTMIRRFLFQKVGGYRADLPYLEDCEFFSRLAERTDFLHLKTRPLYGYRKRRRGSLSKKFKKIRGRYYLEIVRKMILRRYGFKVRW